MPEVLKPIPPPVPEYDERRDDAAHAMVEIYDTTLRDGAQSEEISYSVEDKLKILRALDRLGVQFVEGGWPGANPKDLEFFDRAAREPLASTRLAAFGSTRRVRAGAGKDAGLQALLSAGTPWVTIFGKSWDYHVREALRTTLEENLAMISDSVRFLKESGRRVVYDAEHFFDGYRAHPEYALLTILAAAEAGADRIVLCDTNGGALPDQVRGAVTVARSRLGAMVIGIHAHNDGELATANSLAAVAAGARHVQGTINGYGERCGNANLCSVIPNLELKLGLRCLPPGSLPRLTAASRYVGEVANRTPNGHQAFVGRSAFAHKAGIHVSAIERTSRAYEHIDPAQVGNQTRVLVSDQMGSSNVLNRARAIGIDLSGRPETMRALVERVKELEHQGFQFENAEGSFALLVLEALGKRPRVFQLVDYRVLLTASGSPEATVRVRVRDEEVHAVSPGVGPAHALDQALRIALGGVYPEIAGLRLVDFRVRILDGHDGTAARTRVHVEMGDGQAVWSTTGVDPNLIAATLHAIVESYEYGLLLRRSAGLLPAGAVEGALPGPGARSEAQVHGAGSGPAGNVGVQPRGEGRLPIVILDEVDPGRSEIGA
ncbi:MAG: citramalate synthase [Acidobacteria bacterium 13_1_40CM_4_69_4]|nr:MAG: citramalate synthase [Acidobacteria bacterium 13_1_40CM_4_69_4]